MDAPLGTRVNELPEQITPEFTVIIGVALTFTALTAVFDATHPKTLVPVTE